MTLPLEPELRAPPGSLAALGDRLAASGAAEELAQVPFLLAVAVLTWVPAGLAALHGGPRFFFDFAIYRDAVDSLLAGHPVYLDHFHGHFAYTYPPFSLLALFPLGLGPRAATEVVWWLANAAALVALTERALRLALSDTLWHRLLVATALGGAGVWLLEPVRANMNFGQINVVLALLVLVDLTRRDERLRGCLVGIAAGIKLTPLVFIGYFLVTANWRAAQRAVTTFAATVALGVLVVPHGSARYFLHDVLEPGRVGGVSYWSNQSWYGVLHRLLPHWQAPELALWLALDLATLLFAGLGARWYAAANRQLEAVLCVFVAEVLVSPISWTHHWSWVMLAPVVVVSAWRHERPVALACVALVAVAVDHPFVTHRVAPTGALAANSLALAGAASLVVLVACAARARRGAPAP